MLSARLPFSFLSRAMATSGEFVVAYVTAPSEEVASTLAKGLVKGKLAACVNIVPKVTSVYEWEGKIEEDGESLLILKTRSHLIPNISDFLAKNHPYDVPELIATPIVEGSQSYMQWLGDVLKAPKI